MLVTLTTRAATTEGEYPTAKVFINAGQVERLVLFNKPGAGMDIITGEMLTDLPEDKYRPVALQLDSTIKFVPSTSAEPNRIPLL